MKRNRGFTLLEILCVIFLLGMMASMVMGSLPDGSREVAREHEKILFVMRATAERARLEGKIFGLRVQPGGWEVQVLVRRPATSKPQKTSELIQGYHWQTAMRGRKKMHYSLPERARLRVEAHGESWSSSAQADSNERPQILFLPGGEVTEFTLSLFRIGNGGERGDVKTASKALPVFTLKSAEILSSEGVSL